MREVVNKLNQFCATRHTRRKRPGILAAGFLALALGLMVGVRAGHAATLTWTNTAASGVWQTTTAWTTNGGSTGNLPGPADNAQFTNRSPYTVALNADATVKELLLQNAANTLQTLTLDLGTNSLTLLETSITTPTLAMELADAGSCTSVLYIASSTVAGKGLYCTNSTGTGRVLAGRNGIATILVTNGFVAAIETRTGNGSSGRGTIVLGGANTYYSNSSVFVIGNQVGSKLNSLVISNSASLTVVGAFTLGGAASSTNQLLLDTGGRLFTRAAGNNIGNSTGVVNTATVQGGATWDNGNKDLTIGGTGTGNSLTIGANSAVINISSLTNSAASTLNLTGGLLQASVVISNFGVIRGFGSIAGDTVNASGGQLIPGFGAAVGTIVFSNNLRLASGSTTAIKLDKSQPSTNDLVTVIGALTYGGTLTVAHAGTALAGGDTFKIFGLGSSSGNFAVTNLPSPGSGLVWDASQLGSQGILAVVLPPSVTGPTNQVVDVGANVTISTTVTGAPAPALQWQLNGTNLVDGATGSGSSISGSATSALTITDAQGTDNGTYCLIASNNGAVVTNCMSLTVSTNDVAPTITGPTPQTVIAGNNGTFAASVAGRPGPIMQWQENGTNVAGATSSTLILTNVQFQQNGYSYSLIASNRAGETTNSATLTVIVPPTITLQPQSLVVTNTQSASFSVSADGAPDPTYQWRKNGNAIANATNDTFTIASASPSDMAAYSVVAANAAGSATSSNAILTVNSTMTPVSLSPANGATRVCYDTPLYITFDQPPVLTNAGKVNIYSVTNTVTPVDTIDLSLNNSVNVQTRTIAGDSFNTFPVIITGNTAAIYPHLGLLTANQSYFVTVDNAVFTDTNAALFAGITDSNAWRFTTKPTGPANPTDLVVASDGQGDFVTVQGAVNSVPNNNLNYTLINIRDGTYTELVNVKSKNNITFCGQSRSGTIITYRNNNSLNGGTHSRMAFKVNANDIAIENLTVTNSTPKGGSQAEALMLETNIKRFILNNAEMDSYQDTILANTSGTQAYFYNSLIQGDVDFIWGGGNLFITNCEIRSVTGNSNPNTGNAVTQARTDAGSNGMSFVGCQLTRTSSSVTNCTLGRATGIANGNVAFVSCRIDDHITGWVTGDPAISRYWEYGNSNRTANVAVSYNGTQLANGDDNLVNASTATNWLYGWAPQLAPNITDQPVSLVVTAGLTATFIVGATGVPDPSYQWLENGTNLIGATSATLTITNAQAGDAATYSVIASNIAGSVTSSNAQLTVLVPPVADFSASSTNWLVPMTVTFADASTGTITNWFWDFGDGSTTNFIVSTNPNHTYYAAGTYTVSLIASGPAGSSTNTQSDYIVAVNPPLLVVIPDSLNYDPVTIGQTNSLSFSVINAGEAPLIGTATCSAPFAVTSGDSYNIGGGQTGTVTVAFAPGSATIFNDSVMFASNGGDSTNAVSGTGLTPGSITVTPSALDFGTLIAGTVAQASFTLTNSGSAAVSNGTASVSGGPFSILSGATFSIAGFGTTNVTVQFAPSSAGSFTDSVVFATADSGEATNTITGAAAIVPVAAFSASPTNGAWPLAVTFTDTSTGTITNRYWDFGDGATSNTMATSVMHIYNPAGTNTVGLTVCGPVGASTLTRVHYIIAISCSYTLSPSNASFAVTGGSNTLSVVTASACPWTATSNDGWIQITGGSVSATGSAVVAYTVLSNATSSGSRTGTMTVASQTFRVTQAGDTTAPTVTLTAPTSGIVTDTIAVSATATDNVAVAKVEFYRDGNVLLGTVTTPPYSVTFDTTTLDDGSHCFYARAYDAANSAGISGTNCVTVDNNAPSVPAGLTATAVTTNQINLSWQASSDGNGSGVVAYKIFRDGTQITTAAGTNYSDVGLALGTTYCYKVAARDSVGHTSARTADACAQSFVTPGSLAGTYNGLAIQTDAPTNASSGSLKLVANKTGSFAANLSVGGVKTAFRGRFDAAGNATTTIARKGLNSLHVILHLDLSHGTDQITGTVSDGVFTSELVADRMVYSKSNPCPRVGRYTMVLAPPGSDPDIPQGYGYATLVVATTGSGNLSGALADGTKLAGKAPVSKHGTAPLYALLYKKQGACIGWVTFVASNDTLEATLDWFRPAMPTSAWYPAGFTTNVTLMGEKYVSPATGGPSPAGDREITLDGGNLLSSIVQTVSVHAAGNIVVSAPNNESVKLKLTTRTGQFSGSFRHPALDKTISFNALTLQSDGSGAGYFLGTNASGSVVIEPLP